MTNALSSDAVKVVEATLRRIDDTTANLDIVQNHLRVVALRMENEYGATALRWIREVAGMRAELEIKQAQFAALLVEDEGE